MNPQLLKTITPLLATMNFDKILSEKATELKQLQDDLGSPIYIMTSVTDDSRFQMTIYTSIDAELIPIKSYVITEINHIVTIFSNLKNSINEFKNQHTADTITTGRDNDDTIDGNDGNDDTTDGDDTE